MRSLERAANCVVLSPTFCGIRLVPADDHRTPPQNIPLLAATRGAENLPSPHLFPLLSRAHLTRLHARQQVLPHDRHDERTGDQQFDHHAGI